MKKSTILILTASIVVAAGIPSLALWHNISETNRQLEAQRIEATRAEAAQQKQLKQEQEAAQQEAQHLAQELELQRQEAERLRQQQDLTNQTAEAWRQLDIVLETAASAHTNNAYTPAQIFENMASELAAIPIAQIDGELATLIDDLRRTAVEANQVTVSYATRLQQLDAGVLDAGKTGCDIARAAGEENQLRNCVLGGLFGTFVSAAGASEEVKRLQADYEARSEALVLRFNELGQRKDALGDRLHTTYGIPLP